MPAIHHSCQGSADRRYLRRGPSKWTQIIKWNTDSDIFEYGAWFHGQIYPDRCDLSPDGTKLIYFATNYDYCNNTFPTEWTAISKVPWLTALCVWPNGGTYYGGGLFETDTKVWVNQWYGWSPHYLLDGYATPPDLEISYVMRPENRGHGILLF